MLTQNSIGFVRGILGNDGVFIRTPKRGLGIKEGAYRSSLTLDVPTVTEVILSVTALAPYIAVFQQGVWFLGISPLAFGRLSR